MFLFHSILLFDDFAELDLLETTVKNYCKLCNTFYDILLFYRYNLKKYRFEDDFYFVKSKGNGVMELVVDDICGQYRTES
jgi:hypothetical protein